MKANIFLGQDPAPGAGVPFGMRKPIAALVGPKAVAERRAKLWELGATLHCSIIGTCLMSGELRSLLRRCGAATDKAATDHELHQIAVSAAGRHDAVAKEIHKALDERHKLAISRFAKAGDTAGLLRLWEEAVQNGDIPAAYWALLTHPLSDGDVVRRAFGDIHMLSHLVGAANRGALLKLHRLEGERADLEDKLARQQERLRDAFVSRDEKIAELSAALSAKVESEAGAGLPSDSTALGHVVADLREQLDLEARRRERAERKLQELSGALLSREQERAALAQENVALREESAAAEAALAALSGPDDAPDSLDLRGAIVLYVGGRPRQAAQMKLLVERGGGELLHHDGGIEEHADLLPGLVSRAHVALFPVDCISHAAALSLKQLCRQAGKRFVPLRSSGLTTFLHALKTYISEDR